MSCNPIGNDISTLAPGLQNCHTLQGLSFQSCGLKDGSTLLMLQSLIGHPTLRVLDLGQAYATEGLGMCYNWLTDNGTDTLIQLITTIRNLCYLNCSNQPISQQALVPILESVLSSSSLLCVEAKPLVKGGRSYAEVKAGQAWVRLSKQVREHLDKSIAQQYDGMSYEEFERGPERSIRSPHDVRLIDSVYRNRYAGLARRGLKRLEKQWDEDDDTLQRVTEDMGAL